MKNIIFINSHPIQYFAPLYRYMNDNGVKTSCWYCSDESLHGSYDQEFGSKVKWDIPLLEGYEYKFFKNFSWKPSYNNGFFGLMNLSMIWEVFKASKSVIIVHGYHYFTHFFILLLGKLRGHTICVRHDIPQNHELFKKGIKSKIRFGFLKYILFPRINYFLYIGHQNKLLYQSYKIADRRLIFCPYAVDNDRFKDEGQALHPKRNLIKTKLGIPNEHKVILYSGKYIQKKRPMDLLEAFTQLKENNIWLILMGDGELKNQMLEFIKSYNVERVILTGFVNQSTISEFYSISDVFVMCSSFGENWGLSVNEAMNFNLPLIISDLTGCSDDLVIVGSNGYNFKTGDISDLADKLKKVLTGNSLTNATPSVDIVHRYNYDTIVKNISVLLQ